MKLVCKTDKFVVYDDVLPEEQFNAVWKHVERETYGKPMSNGSWLPVWRLSDGECLGTKSYDYPSPEPLNNIFDGLGPLFVKLAEMNPEIVGPYKTIGLRTYIYGAGTKLSWHDDSDVYSAALTFYVHKKQWGSTWGGELFVYPYEPTEEMLKHRTAAHLDTDWEDNYLNTVGIGTWILPKSNRIVLMKGGTYHSIARIDPDAGRNTRCSIVGFYKK